MAVEYVPYNLTEQQIAELWGGYTAGLSTAAVPVPWRQAQTGAPAASDSGTAPRQPPEQRGELPDGRMAT